MHSGGTCPRSDNMEYSHRVLRDNPWNALAHSFVVGRLGCAWSWEDGASCGFANRALIVGGNSPFCEKPAP